MSGLLPSNLTSAPIAPVDSTALQLAVEVDLGLLTSAVTAAVGLFVAYQAFRGFSRTDRRPMLFLAVGVLFVTTLPIVARYVAVSTVAASDAEAVLAMTALQIVGLASIFYALRGA